MSIESAVHELERTGNYRILKKHVPESRVFNAESQETLVAAFLDLETTDLDYKSDKIIELAIVRFRFDRQGIVYSTEEGISMLEDPGMPIAEAITRLTGLTDVKVRGKVIDESAVAALLDDAKLIIAHNARFDRPFFDSRFPSLAERRWVCTMDAIPWREEGFGTTNLEYIGYRHGIFYEQHRALADCHAGIHALTQTLPISGRTAMDRLLEHARKRQAEIYAWNSPFDSKDLLKQRGYRWNPSERVWHTTIDEGAVEPEIAFLRGEVYRCEADIQPRFVTALQRYRQQD